MLVSQPKKRERSAFTTQQYDGRSTGQEISREGPDDERFYTKSIGGLQQAGQQ